METKLLVFSIVVVMITGLMVGPAIYTWRKRRKD
jgi:K+-transporting ATPase A subunit